MINMIQEVLRIDTMVGQNGLIWIRARDNEVLRLAIKAFKMIEAQAHTSKLTDRVKEMLEEGMAALRGDDNPEDEPYEESSEPEEESASAEAHEPEVVEEAEEPTEIEAVEEAKEDSTEEETEEVNESEDKETETETEEEVSE